MAKLKRRPGFPSAHQSRESVESNGTCVSGEKPADIPQVRIITQTQVPSEPSNHLAKRRGQRRLATRAGREKRGKGSVWTS